MTDSKIPQEIPREKVYAIDEMWLNVDLNAQKPAVLEINEQAYREWAAANPNRHDGN